MLWVCLPRGQPPARTVQGLHNITWAHALTAAALLCGGAGPLQAQVRGPEALTVLHWWTSAGERLAVDDLGQYLLTQDLAWRNEPVPGGGGAAAAKVLKTRLLAGDPPDAAQLIGLALGEWADLGVVLRLDAVAARGRWPQVMFPEVLHTIRRGAHVLAAPVGVHRINWLYYDQAVWNRFGFPVPSRFEDLDPIAATLRENGLVPFAWSDEPWQVATVFESLLLAEAGPDAYAELAAGRRWQAWQASAVARALDRLRWLRGLNGTPPGEHPWTESARQLYQGRAAMLVMGDWVGGELMAWGAQPGKDYGCVAVPGTAGAHLYSIDTLAMLVGRTKRVDAQQRLADVLTRAPAQLVYNRAKGSVPVRSDIDPRTLDACGRASWQLLADAAGRKVPSLAHRMAAPDSMKDALAAEVHRFVRNPPLSAAQTQSRLAAIVRGLATSSP